MIPVRAKSDVFEAFKQFKAFAENQIERRIKTLQDDKGGEYMSNAMLKFMTECRIKRQHTVTTYLAPILFLYFSRTFFPFP